MLLWGNNIEQNISIRKILRNKIEGNFSHFKIVSL